MNSEPVSIRRLIRPEMAATPTKMLREDFSTVAMGDWPAPADGIAWVTLLIWTRSHRIIRPRPALALEGQPYVPARIAPR